MNGKNQNKHLISIIIPTYKRPIYLKKILNCLISNYLNFKFFEVIICDSDKSLRNKLIINEFRKKRLFKISYFNLDRNNHSQKRNLGIKKAKSNFLIFLDDDCFPEKTFVKDYFKILKKIEQKVLWLSCWMIHNANHIRENFDGIKVGGHQASCASMVSMMVSLYFDVLKPEDRVAVKPHASPVFHAIQYLAGLQKLEKIKNFRGGKAARRLKIDYKCWY